MCPECASPRVGHWPSASPRPPRRASPGDLTNWKPFHHDAAGLDKDAAKGKGGGKGGKGGGGKGGGAARRGGVARLLRALTELAPVHLADELKLHARLAKQVSPEP